MEIDHDIIPFTSGNPRFAIAVNVVLAHEGGLVNDPDDPGGITNYGVSLRWLKDQSEIGDIDGDGDIDAADVRSITREQAAHLYFERFWRPGGYEHFQSPLATKILDLAVNMGPKQAHKCLQRAATACGHPLLDDGIIGPVTRTVIRSIPDQNILVPPLGSEAASVYRQIVIKQPRSAKYLMGWLRRAYFLPPGWNTQADY